MGKLAWFFPLLALSAGAGCDRSGVSTAGLPGAYQGVLTELQADRQVRALVGAEAVEQVVGSVKLTVRRASSGNGETLEFGISVAGRDLDLMAPGIFDGARRFRLEAGGCFERSAGSAERACFDGQGLRIELESTARGRISLVLEKNGAPGEIPLEPPQPYAAGDLRDRAMKLSFDSQIEFERVVQARLAAKAARLNLLPHFSFGSIFSIISLDATALIRAVGDLAPFLLPTRWMRAHQADGQAQAELHGWHAMKVDAGSIAEGIALALLRDERSAGIMREHRSLIARVRDRTLGLEEVGVLPRGSSDEASSLLGEADLALGLLAQAIDQQYAALSQASGFVNPHAISEVRSSQVPSIESPPPFGEEELRRVAVLNSPELQQMDAHTEDSRHSRLQRFFNWIDPQGESAGALGFGYWDYLRIGDSQIEELKLRRIKLLQLLLQKAAGVAIDGQSAIASYRLARENLERHDRRLARLEGSHELGIVVPAGEWVAALQGRMKSALDLCNAEFAFYVAASKADRLALSGAYGVPVD